MCACSYFFFELFARASGQIKIELSALAVLSDMIISLAMPALTFWMLTLSALTKFAKLRQDSVCNFFVNVFHRIITNPNPNKIKLIVNSSLG